MLDVLIVLIKQHSKLLYGYTEVKSCCLEGVYSQESVNRTVAVNSTSQCGSYGLKNFIQMEIWLQHEGP